MAKGIEAYTEIGKRIVALGKSQRGIARVLGLTQQTVSLKLRGERAILLPDLKALGKAYKVPFTHFLEKKAVAPELAKALHRIRTKRGPLRDFAIRASQLRAADLKKLLAIAEAVGR